MPPHVIVAVPAETPVTTPVPLIVATAALLLLQGTPVVASVSDVVPPAHTDNVPVIGAGSGVTVSTAVA